MNICLAERKKQLISCQAWIDSVCESFPLSKKKLFSSILSKMADEAFAHRLASCSVLDIVDASVILLMFDSEENRRSMLVKRDFIQDTFRKFYNLPVEITFGSYEQLSKEDTEVDRAWIDLEKPSLDEIWAKVVDNLERGTTRRLAKSDCKLIAFNRSLIDLPEIYCNSKLTYRHLQHNIKPLKLAFKQTFGVDITEIFLTEKQELPSKSNYSLTEDQFSALDKLMSFTRSSESLFRVIGYAGTGKSFLVCEYIKWLNTQRISLLAAAPTNKAAKNLRQIALSAGLDLEVKTVAQLLGQQPELNEDTGKETFASIGTNCIGEYKIIIVDEFSMVNRENFTEIRDEARVHGTKVIFVGDAAQLPPVKETEPMAARHPMSEARLDKIVRYDGDIAKVAEIIRSNKVVPKFTSSADKTILCLSQKEWLNRAFELFESEEFSADADYVRLLAWRNKTVRELNRAVRLHLWGESALPFVSGDRLIALKPLFRPRPGAKGKNKWKIFINNSEEAIVTTEGVLRELSFNRQSYQYWEVMVRSDQVLMHPSLPQGGRSAPERGWGQEQKLLILHEDSLEIHAEKVRHYAQKKQWSSYFDLSRMFDNVGYAYALTCHKAQGSTIEHVFLDGLDMQRSGDRCKLLYTALTRTRKQAFVLS